MVYGTLVVMATLTIGYAGETHSWTLAIAVFCTAFVLRFAHGYAHGVSESIVERRRLALHKLTSVAGHERGILLAAAVPTSVLLLGAAKVMRETAAVWLALASALVTLASTASAMHASRASGQERRWSQSSTWHWAYPSCCSSSRLHTEHQRHQIASPGRGASSHTRADHSRSPAASGHVRRSNDGPT